MADLRRSVHAGQLLDAGGTLLTTRQLYVVRLIASAFAVAVTALFNS